jgi:DNA-directed RNA polymerase subunit RPC12/RpoP
VRGKILFPYTFDTVTATTLTVIGVILVLYFLVLKRKGWLREDWKETHYRCPNQECRKIFEKPVKLSDLSQNPPRVYSACPHCGFEIEMASPSAVGKKTRMPFKIPLSPKESTKISGKPKADKDNQKLPAASPKPLQGRPPKCSHFLGYLRKIPKNTTIPDQCFSCQQMVECLSYDISEQKMSE